MKAFVMAAIGFSGGIAIAGGVFAFIAMIGIVPRLIQKTKTYHYVIWYENSIMLGGIFGTLAMLENFTIKIGLIGDISYGFFSGVFVGCLAVSLAEVLDVIPISMRRINLKKGVGLFIFIIALGKLFGSLIYFYAPGFIQIK